MDTDSQSHILCWRSPLDYPFMERGIRKTLAVSHFFFYSIALFFGVGHIVPPVGLLMLGLCGHHDNASWGLTRKSSQLASRWQVHMNNGSQHHNNNQTSNIKRWKKTTNNKICGPWCTHWILSGPHMFFLYVSTFPTGLQPPFSPSMNKTQQS